MIGADRQLPLVHVENCADAFATAVDSGLRAEGTYNIVDHPDLTVRRFVADHLRRSGRFGFAVPVAFRTALAGVSAVHRLTPGPLRSRLPSFVAPGRFEARYGIVRVDGARFQDATGWRPPLRYEQCLERTYGSAVAN
jgi:nucleoside-diphosphate-sugar epimerase